MFCNITLHYNYEKSLVHPKNSSTPLIQSSCCILSQRIYRYDKLEVFGLGWTGTDRSNWRIHVGLSGMTITCYHGYMVVFRLVYGFDPNELDLLVKF